MNIIIKKIKNIPFLRFFWHKIKSVFGRKSVRVLHNHPPAIIQIVPWYGKHDAIGNNVSDISEMFTSKKISNYILFNSSNVVKKNCFYYNGSKINPDDILVYHMAMGSDLSRFYKNAKCKKKVLVYHNITPAVFFKDMPDAKEICELGRKQLIEISAFTDLAICVSSFNEKELKNIGYKNTIVIPISHHIDNLLKYSIDNNSVVSGDAKTQFLFVGRISRNKCIHDVIKTFKEFSQFSQNACLNIVGRIDNNNYYNELKKLIIKYNLKNKVFFYSNVDEKELARFYSTANIFLCESEHEGFCVPLIEAMAFKVPIFAYDSSAVAETLGGAGFLFKNKSHTAVAKKILNFLNNSELIQKTKNEEYKRYLCFESQTSLNRFYDVVINLNSDKILMASKLYDFASNNYMKEMKTKLPFSNEQFIKRFLDSSFKPNHLYNFKIMIKRILIRISPRLYSKIYKIYKRI